MGTRARWLLAVVLVLGLGVGVRATVWDPMRVSSGSMAPTVCEGDVVVIDHVGAGRGLGSGDIVTFPRPGTGETMIKRVVAVGGQRVGIDDAVLTVDGRRIDEPYVDPASIDGVFFGPVTVPTDTVFVMGDDREVSIDSRSFGPVPVSLIDGRLVTTLGSAGCTRHGG